MGLFGEKRVQDVMTERPRAIVQALTVSEAAEIMELEDVGSLPVVEERSRLIGIVTDRDIVVRAIAKKRDPEEARVFEIMSTEPVTVEPEAKLDSAVELMSLHQVRRLPVAVDGELVGMLAQADVAIEAGDKKTGEVVEDISEPADVPRI